MTKASDAAKLEAFTRLREWIKPGDTVHTSLDNVSSSGMSRTLRVLLIRSTDGEPMIFHPNHAVSTLLGYRRAKHGDGFVVGGCGQDMGFHVVHSLGYALFGKEASEGTGKEANALRKAIGAVTKSYLTQGGAEMPDYRKPGREWFGAAGYALKHLWL